ncbi:MAG: DUF402 domain-containing protein [Chloroflexia bacterium]|nr:DUF402 domain-containing protein [Chloroflexia bacterium]
MRPPLSRTSDVEHADASVRASGWRVDPATEGHWAGLTPGLAVMALKLAPDGSPRARYHGTIIATTEHERWIEIEARWTHEPVTVGGLRFAPGDVLREFYSPVLPFNVFAVHDPSVALRGWYANVTYPTRVDVSERQPLLIWHDLYLDLVAFPDGSFVRLDDDELSASHLARSDPALCARIIEARDELVRRFQTRRFPFRT